jgi:hypothetical protein
LKFKNTNLSQNYAMLTKDLIDLYTESDKIFREMEDRNKWEDNSLLMGQKSQYGQDVFLIPDRYGNSSQP